MVKSATGLSVDELDTPALLVDLDVLDENVGRIALWPVLQRARTR